MSLSCSLFTILLCFCILMAKGHDMNTFLNVMDPERIAQIYRIAVKNNEAVVLVFDNDPYHLDNKFQHTKSEKEGGEINLIKNLKDLLKAMHHKKYLEKKQKLDFLLPKTQKHASLREASPTYSKILEGMMKSLGNINIQCLQKQICQNNCKGENGIKCKTDCETSFNCDSSVTEKVPFKDYPIASSNVPTAPKYDECSDGGDECEYDTKVPIGPEYDVPIAPKVDECSDESDECGDDAKAPVLDEESYTAIPPYVKGSEESTSCEN